MSEGAAALYAVIGLEGLATFEGGLDRAYEKVDATSAKIDTRLGKVGSGLTTAGKSMTEAFTVPIAAFAAVGLDKLGKINAVALQSTAEIRNTGGAAGVTAKQVKSLADALEAKTSVDAVAIQSGQNFLLSMDNIKNSVGEGNNIFSRASGAMVDLSVKMGGVPQAAKALGKALQEPAQYMGALARGGVTFSATQKAVIKDLVDGTTATKALNTMGIQLTATQTKNLTAYQKTMPAMQAVAKAHVSLDAAQQKELQSLTKGNNLLAAQKMVLNQVESQAGGLGKALGQSVPGQIDSLEHSFSNMGANLMGVTLPALLDVTHGLDDMFDSVSNLPGPMRDLVGVTLLGVAALGPMLFVLGGAAQGVNALAAAYARLTGTAAGATAANEAEAASATAVGTANTEAADASVARGMMGDAGWATKLGNPETMINPGTQLEAGAAVLGQGAVANSATKGLTSNFAEGWGGAMDAGEGAGIAEAGTTMAGAEGAGAGLLTVLGPVGVALAGVTAAAVLGYEAWEHWGTTSKTAQAALRDIGTAAHEAMPQIQAEGAKTVAWYQSTFLPAWNSVAKAAKPGLDQLAQNVSTDFRAVENAVETVVPPIAKFVEDHFGQIQIFLTAPIRAAGDIIDASLQVIGGNFTGALHTMEGAATDVGRGLAAPFELAAEAIEDSVEGLGSAIDGEFGGMASEAVSWGESIMENVAQGITDGISDAASAAAAAVSSVASAAMNAVPSAAAGAAGGVVSRVKHDAGSLLSHLAYNPLGSLSGPARGALGAASLDASQTIGDLGIKQTRGVKTLNSDEKALAAARSALAHASKKTKSTRQSKVQSLSSQTQSDASSLQGIISSLKSAKQQAAQAAQDALLSVPQEQFTESEAQLNATMSLVQIGQGPAGATIASVTQQLEAQYQGEIQKYSSLIAGGKLTPDQQATAEQGLQTAAQNLASLQAQAQTDLLNSTTSAFSSQDGALNAQIALAQMNGDTTGVASLQQQLIASDESEIASIQAMLPQLTVGSSAYDQANSDITQAANEVTQLQQQAQQDQTALLQAQLQQAQQQAQDNLNQAQTAQAYANAIASGDIGAGGANGLLAAAGSPMINLNLSSVVAPSANQLRDLTTMVAQGQNISGSTYRVAGNVRQIGA